MYDLAQKHNQAIRDETRKIDVSYGCPFAERDCHVISNKMREKRLNDEHCARIVLEPDSQHMNHFTSLTSR